MSARSLRIGSYGVSLNLPKLIRSASSSTKNLDAIARRRAGRVMPDQASYKNWTKSGLIQRIRELESRLHEKPCETPKQQETTAVSVPDVGHDGSKENGAEVKKPKAKRKMDPSRYSTRYIALKFAYLGKKYGGFEFQAEGNQPSIEEELWKALTKTCLIFPEDERVVDFDCCEYSKCGRTDRGVSAFGQVVGLRVRSNRPLRKKRAKLDDASDTKGRESEGEEGQEEDDSFDPIRDEIPYPNVLNRILPKDIRVLAWCPAPPEGFSARFSCRERQYRYFFTNPAFGPAPTHLEPPPSQQEGIQGMTKPGWLDIEAMRDAAKRYEGEHDFRNLCKIDPAKQITNFHRRIFESDIVEVEDAASALPYLASQGYAPKDLLSSSPSSSSSSGSAFPKVYYFHVRGSAFLWHQIRHMVAVLFLVGQGLEPPSLVSQLLDVHKTPSRPNYVMADEVPLVLWDCIFPADLAAADAHPETARTDSLPWVYVGEDVAARRAGQSGVMDDAWQIWRGHKMDEVLAGQLLQNIAQQEVKNVNMKGMDNPSHVKSGGSVKIFEGGNSGRMGGKYTGVMRMKMLETAEEQNDKYARRKGYADSADMRRQKGMQS